MNSSFAQLRRRIISCRQCPRLVHWRELTAHQKTKRFADQRYWGKPVPGFGDEKGKILIVGLAPAAHGANRTGRMFTGDESGHWLYRALWKAGFANQTASTAVNDGLRLKQCYITASCRCAPPLNKPTKEEIRNCRPYILTEIVILTRLHVIIGLGKIGFDAAFDCVKALGLTQLRSRPRFSHGIAIQLNADLTLIGSYHPSQQNTFTGRLTEPMFDAIFRHAKRILKK